MIMGESTAEEAVLVSTETPRGQRNRCGENVVISAMELATAGAAVWFALAPDDCFSPRGSLWVRIPFVAILGALAVATLIIPLFRVRGTWRLDRNHISFDPLRGDPEHLSWSDIEAIRWRTDALLFRAGTTYFPLVLEGESQERKAEVKEFVRERLANAFDLAERRVEPISTRGSICRVLIGAAIATPLMLLSLAGMLAQDLYLDPNGRWRELQPLWLLCVFGPLMLVALFLAKQQSRSFWRYRRAAP
jgi:hypothetical protein